MSYAEKNLAPGETIVYRARYHWIYYRTALALLLVAAVFALWWWLGSRLGSASTSSFSRYGALLFLGAAVAAFLVRRVRNAADEFVVTNRRVLRKLGLFAREAEHAPIEKIQDITIDQGMTARLLGYGTVALETASERGRIVFPDIARPEAFRNAIWGQGTVTPGVPGAIPAPAAAVASPPAAQRLADLEDLRTRGLLSTEEYARKREEILKSL
ncbi:MAG: PH domain-containing protein [Acidobacteriota bacterium]